MDATDGASGLVHVHPHQHADIIGRVFLVGKEVLGIHVDIAVEFFRPVAFLAGVLGRAEVLDRSRDGPLVVEYHAARAKNDERPAMLLIRKIQTPPVRRLSGVLDLPAPLRPRAEKTKDDTNDQETRHDEVGKDAKVGILLPLREIHPYQQRERKQRGDRQHTANGADPIIKKRTRFYRHR